MQALKFYLQVIASVENKFAGFCSFSINYVVLQNNDCQNLDAQTRTTSYYFTSD